MSDHLVTDVGEEILATYTLCLVGKRATDFESNIHEMAAVFELRRVVPAAEEDITELMPDGYRVVIKEWSSDE